jgi:hypothetical protein
VTFIVVTPHPDGTFNVFVEDHSIRDRSAKSMCHATYDEAQAEGNRIVRLWQLGVLSQGAAAGGGA